MNLKSILSVLFLLIISTSFSQENLQTSFTIPANLINNANAVIRSNEVQISLKSSYEMHTLTKRVITVLNKKGDDAINAYVHYDNNVKIKDLEATVYNAAGAQIKKIKKNDFEDESAVSGGTLYSDSRVKYLEYTAIGYPYTVEFICETQSNNTAFIQSFMPIDDYFLSVENSTYQITFPNDLTIRTKEKNFENFDLKKNELEGSIKYKVENIQVIKPEEYSPSFRNIIPMVMVASNKFNYQGVYATEVGDWNNMGKWFYNNLLKGRDNLPEKTKQEVLNLVKGIVDPIDKAKIIYKYVQDNTRYISVQVGIGGMQPIAASDVDLVKYGDCKGLTNYTKALLNVVGVKSNYTRLYASSNNQLSVDKEFVSFGGQTNHVILNIPTEGDNIWLECTSQKLPFGFIGDFTDDRDVLVITPEGGKIQHTKKYEVEENTQTIKGNYSISNEGTIEAETLVNSKGIQYHDKHRLETETERDLDKYYKKRWRYINGLSITSMHIENNKNDIEFIESVNFKATNYTKIIGDRMLLTVNALNRNTHVPDRYRNRKFPLKVKRGFKDIDEIEIEIPSGYKIESLPKNNTIENKFGHYKTEIVVKDENKLVYKREFKINDGEFPKEDYKDFRAFYKTVSRQDNSKIALIKK